MDWAREQGGSLCVLQVELGELWAARLGHVDGRMRCTRSGSLHSGDLQPPDIGFCPPGLPPPSPPPHSWELQPPDHLVGEAPPGPPAAKIITSPAHTEIYDIISMGSWSNFGGPSLSPSATRWEGGGRDRRKSNENIPESSGIESRPAILKPRLQ
jgi:hypothetical protein